MSTGPRLRHATLALSAGYYLMAGRIPESQLADAIGPQGLPRTYALLLAVLSIVMIAQAIMARRRAVVTADDQAARATAQKEWHSALRGAGMLGFGIAYLVLLPIIGYALSLVLLIIAAAWYQEGSRRPWLIPTAIVGAGVSG